VKLWQAVGLIIFAWLLRVLYECVLWRLWWAADDATVM
jgi:hypothetical protein